MTERWRIELARMILSRSHTAVFVRMEGNLAVINTQGEQIKVPCVGYYPPVIGDSVQVEWRNGSPAVIGPAVQRNPLGVISGTGSPLATVTVDGVAYLLPYHVGYTPTIGDQVVIDWISGTISGALSVVPPPKPQPPAPDDDGGTPGGAPAPKPVKFDVTVRATRSGKYDTNWSNWWGGDEVWASNNNKGAWFYGNRIRDAVKGGDVTRIDIYLPLISQVGSCSIGLHSYPTIPGGNPSITSLTTLSDRKGWVRLPQSFADYLDNGGRGIGVVSPSGGFTKWAGVSNDKLSGAIRLRGTR